MKLEAAGVPTVVVTTTAFAPLTGQVADSLGLPGLRILTVPHPLGGTDAAVVESWADDAVDELLGLLAPTAGG